jgi:TolB-like protein/Tfp pilus assembly protein PilF
MIVVLPFKNLGLPEDEYFAQGMREEISNKLASLGSIGVISRSSAEKFAKSDKTAKEIGKELGVDYILEGTIQWAKNNDKTSRIRIIPQLVRVSDDINIWSESYDRIINDVFFIQNEIAESVVGKLGIKILPGQTVTGPPPTNNLDAYDYYLKAHKFHYGPTTGANIKTAVKLYEKAIELDPDYAAAHAQLSVAYNAFFYFRWDRDSLNLKKAAFHLNKAKELNPNIAEVHLAQFFYYIWFTNAKDLEFQELKKVLEIQPNNAEAHYDISGFYREMGKNDLAKQCEQKALQLDPLNARYPWAIGLGYKYRRDYKNAEKYLKRAVEISPDNSQFHVDRALNYIFWKGDTKLAWQTVKNIKDDEYLESFCNIFIYLNILDRKFDEALKQLKSSEKEYENSYVLYIPNSLEMALIYRYMRKYDLSKKYFEASIIQLEKMIIKRKDDFRLHFALCRSFAGIGDTNNAIEELNKGLGLITMDSIQCKNERSWYLSLIYTLTGDYNNALKHIDFLLSNPPGYSVNMLKLNPLFDPLRNLPGYKRIVDKYSSMTLD